MIAIAVLSPTELASAGYLAESEAKALQTANEVVNDPKCTEEDCESNLKILRDASKKLRSNKQLQSALMKDVAAATSEGFRPWEKVGDAYITLEPFAMANGQLTQSYKVKRDSVIARYGDELPK